MNANSGLSEVALDEIRKCLHQEGLTKIERRWAAYGVWRMWRRIEPLKAVESGIPGLVEDAA